MVQLQMENLQTLQLLLVELQYHLVVQLPMKLYLEELELFQVQHKYHTIQQLVLLQMNI